MTFQSADDSEGQLFILIISCLFWIVTQVADFPLATWDFPFVKTIGFWLDKWEKLHIKQKYMKYFIDVSVLWKIVNNLYHFAFENVLARYE